MAASAYVICESTMLVMKMKAKHFLRNPKRGRNVTNVLRMEKVRKLAPGSEVLVYIKIDGWKEYPLVRVTGNEVDVILPKCRISSSSISVVKPYYVDTEEKDKPERFEESTNDATPSDVDSDSSPNQGTKS